MDPIILSLILQFPHYSPWIIFISMVLTGCNLPISEDFMILLSGILASTFIPGKAFALWASVFFGAYIADQIAYWTGRLIGPKLLKFRLTKQLITEERLKKVHRFYEKYGFWSFTIGRFIPFGVRNCLYISAGMGNMTYKKFIMIDTFAALLSTTTGFFVAFALGKAFGRHFEDLFNYLNNLDFLLLAVAAGVVMVIIGFFWYKTVKKKHRHKDDPPGSSEEPTAKS